MNFEFSRIFLIYHIFLTKKLITKETPYNRLKHRNSFFVKECSEQVICDKLWEKQVMIRNWELVFGSRELLINIKWVVELQRWLVLKSKIFGQESTYSKEILFRKSFDDLGFVKKCQNRIFKVNFWCQKSTKFFQKEKFQLWISI